MTFTIYPAIDIRGGHCVRLLQGDYARETIYGDPVAMAVEWRSLGASWLHVVDLDGALQGVPVNTAAIRGILEAIDIPIQVGGGIRERRDIEQLLDWGVSRVIIGTVAMEDLDALLLMVRGFEHRVAIGLDVLGGELRARGWREQSRLTLVDLLGFLEGMGIERAVYTDISRDGTLEGYDVAGLEKLARSTSLSLIASGGVGNIEDIRAISERASLGVEGVVVGRALYTGDITLPDALEYESQGA
jgi:phosphoribosylformimino-5-aminoimidazole carboxamide ribotide isomerase